MFGKRCLILPLESLKKILLFSFFLVLFLTGCREHPWNSPHPLADYGKNWRFGSFALSPKTLDPAQSFGVDEQIFIAQIYEPPLQYDYLKRPYTLIPLTASALPTIHHLDAQGQLLPDNASDDQIAYTTYDIHIQPGIFFQPHPAFAKNKLGQYRYLGLPEADMKHITQLSDFTHSGTRELIAEDYVYEIKRFAHPALDSPILGVMSKYIVGMTAYAKQLRQVYDAQKNQKDNFFLDLRNYPLTGIKIIDKYTYRITLHGQYPQFLYWLAMSYFAPIPWEADYFYSLPMMRKKNITFDWYPVGTGPYLLSENNPNKQMVLSRNPNFRLEYYPTEGEPTDIAKGYLKNAGKRLPFVDKYIFSLEKEAIPRWNKFLQGYYDQSTISEDNFAETIEMDSHGNPHLTLPLVKKGIQLSTSVVPRNYFYAFNMLDKTVGGNSDRARKLRQAISIAIDQEEFISIFLNGRGIPAQGPIPPTIFGYITGKEGVNPYVYDYIEGKLQRKSIAAAKKILAEAGYPNGRDLYTGKPLTLRYDSISISPSDKDQFAWLRKQFTKLGIELNVETTDTNRYLEKLRNGDTQIFTYGWVADYPDPENFLFLLYGPNGEVKYGGLNVANYQNSSFDNLFDQMKGMSNGPKRLEIIQQILDIIRFDSPWVWGVFPKEFILNHSWFDPIKPSPMIYNTLKYQSIDPSLRVKLIQQWNQPDLWPLLLLILLVLILLLPAGILYWKKMHSPISRK